jgi:hypothetical protein
MPAACDDPILTQLAALRVELVEQACALERQGRLDAADVALAASHRVAAIATALDTPGRTAFE